MLDWEKYSEVADRFQRKARFEDREDLRDSIILRLAEVEGKRDGKGPLSEWGMLRVASYVVMDYWRAEKRNGHLISLNMISEDGDENTEELIDTLADDRAIDLDAWVDARVWLLGCPKRLVGIVYKRASGIPLDNADKLYLGKWREKAQKRLF